MSSQDKPEDKSQSFWDSVKQGYVEQDAEVKKDTAPLHEKLAEGAVDGVAETIAHPFRWVRSFFK